MAIQVNHLSKKFRIFKREAGLKGAVRSFFHRQYEDFYALQDIQLTMESGEILGILGENGAGKTTLIKLLVGLLHPTSGQVSIDGFTPWERKNEFLRNISIVMGQKNQLWWDIPASESFLLNQKIYSIDDEQYKKTLNELTDLLDISTKLNTQVRRLSLGERMKMEIIAALLHRPKILLLDEPTIGLDVISQSKIREFIKYHNEKRGTTIILTSHYMTDIQALCKRVLVIHKGRALYDADFSKLVNRINPSKKLTFEFYQGHKTETINQLKIKFDLTIDEQVLTAELPDAQLNELLVELFKIHKPKSFSLEELPVEETMKSFFADPEKFV